MAPMNSPMKYLIASPPSMPPVIQMPTVTAGLRCAPLNWPTAYTATMTAMPQPKVITIQPEFWALEWFNSTAATTPSPRRIRIAVPIISAPMMLNETPLLERERGIPARPRGATLGRPYSRGISQVNARGPGRRGRVAPRARSGKRRRVERAMRGGQGQVGPGGPSERWRRARLAGADRGHGPLVGGRPGGARRAGGAIRLGARLGVEP